MVVGPWLTYCLHAVYDRYVSLCEAFSRAPDLNTIALDPASFWTPTDMMAFVSAIVDDRYNLQLSSQVLGEMGYTFPARTLDDSWPRRPAARRPHAVARTLARHGLSLARKVVSRTNRRRVRFAVCDLSCPRVAVWALARRTRFRALPLSVVSRWSFRLPVATFDARRSGLGGLPVTDEFQRIFVTLLPRNFPTLYLEGYEQARGEALRNHPSPLPVIASATGWYVNEAFKLLAAESARRRGRLVAIQHGAGYGMFRMAPAELHEARLADSYWVWGWAEAKAPSLRNVPDPRLSLLAVRGPTVNRRRRRTVLFVATEHPRYLYRFHSTPVDGQWNDYFDWHERFLASLPDAIRRVIRFRLPSLEFGNRVRQRVRHRFPSLRFDGRATFQRRLRSCRIAVLDHLGTTCLQALAADVPTVLFWDPERWEARPEAEPYFDGLRSAGILWDSPEAAAAKVAEIYPDPHVWWRSRVVRSARDRFVERFALARAEWKTAWVEAISREISSSRSGS